jgi:hypothetical protein
MATIAVFLVLGGSAVAATHLPGDSVGTKQLEKKAVTPAKLSAAAKAALTGSPGPIGPQGREGPQGDEGPRGPKGEAGSVATPPAALFETTEFSDEDVDSSTAVSTLSFTPAEGGEVLLRSRGFCNISPTGSDINEIDLSMGGTPAEAFEQPAAHWGLIRVSRDSETFTQAYGFTAERIISVEAGNAESIGLYAMTVGSGSTKQCSGTMTVQAIS